MGLCSCKSKIDSEGQNRSIVEDNPYNQINTLPQMSTEEIDNKYFNSIDNNDIKTLISLVDYDTPIEFKDNSYKEIFASYNIPSPKTIGECSLMQIYMIASNIIEEANVIEIQSSVVNNINVDFIKQLLFYFSETNKLKKHISLLLLLLISNNTQTSLVLKHTIIIQHLITYLISLGRVSIKSYKFHIIATMKILGNIYTNSINLRNYFIDKGGLQALYTLFDISDKEIILEALYRVEDLIFSNEDTLIDEIVLKLTKVNIYKTLNDLLKTIQSNEEIIDYVNDNIAQLLLIFNNNYNNQ